MTSFLHGAPKSWPSMPANELLSYSSQDLAEVQRSWIQHRIDTLRARIPALEYSASSANIRELSALEQAPPLFFDNSMYKGYPMRAIEECRFDVLTRWLQKLTSHDLSNVNTGTISTIMEWLDRVDESGMWVSHSSSTGGKFSFLPRAQTEKLVWLHQWIPFMEALTSLNVRTNKRPCFFYGYAEGHHGLAKMSALVGKSMAPEGEFFPSFEGRVSSDLMSLAGRLQAAESDSQKAEIRERLQTLLVENQHQAQTSRAQLHTWLNRMAAYRDQPVFVFGITGMLLHAALEGRTRGMKGMLHPESMVLTGGGLKGMEAPSNWEHFLQEFYGVERIHFMYGTTECLSFCPSGADGRYYFLPWTVPFVLDDKGQCLPRRGTQTGRLALFDLLGESYWGGFTTGDKVTLHFDHNFEPWRAPCLAPSIDRYESASNEDKVNCGQAIQEYSQLESVESIYLI